MKTFIFSIVLTLVSFSGYTQNSTVSDFEGLFDTKNINRETTINGVEYYELDFEEDIFDRIELNSVTIKKYISEPIKKIYNVDITTDTILGLRLYGNLGKADTIFLNPLLDGTVTDWYRVKNEIFIPKRVNCDFKPRYNTYINEDVPSNIFKYAEVYGNEIDSLQGSSTEEYTKFLKNKAIEFHNSYDKIEDVILHTSLYIINMVEYDLDYTMNQFDVKKNLDDRRGVCAGYSELFSIMIDTIARVDSSITMHSTMTYELPQGLHICNLVDIKGYLYQIDLTALSHKYNKTNGRYFSNSNSDNSFLRKRLNYYHEIIKHEVKYDESLETYQYIAMKWSMESSDEHIAKVVECDRFLINFNTEENIKKYILDRMLPIRDNF
jgi:hypothetical protein